MPARADTEGGMTGLLVRGMQVIAGEQLASGEIANYRQLGYGRSEYCFSPLASAYVHDALAAFDPLSAEFDSRALEAAGPAARIPLGRMALQIRRKIRRYLAWQQCSNETWRFFGNAGVLPADLDTTACASLALLDGVSARTSGEPEAGAEALERFPMTGGLFSSPGSRPAGGEESPLLTLVANANCIACLAARGAEYRTLAAVLSERAREVESGPAGRLPFHFALAKAWRHTRAPEFEALASQEAQLLAEAGHAGSPLAAALRLTALLDFGVEGRPALLAAAELRTWAESQPAWSCEAFVDPHCGSPALTAAVSIPALARAAAIFAEEELAACA